jgi:AcrR family transcriptional regulator
MARPRIHDDDTRTALLAAAGRIVATDGPGALSVRRLADAVDTSTQAIYSLFDSKQGLIAAMYREGFATLDRHLSSVPWDDDPVTHLRAMMLAYRASAREQPHLYDVMFACPFPDFEPSEAERQYALSTLDLLHQALQRHAEAGAFAGRDPWALTLQVWALAHGLASLELQEDLGPASNVEPEAIWTTAIEDMLAGITARDRPGSSTERARS